MNIFIIIIGLIFLYHILNAQLNERIEALRDELEDDDDRTYLA